jgi:TM2 domain-containing membrane protein YozV
MTTNPVVAPKSRVAYVVLAIFLGMLGLHNFYAGYTKKAVIQLLITVLTLGLGGWISWIWAIVDLCTVTRDAPGIPFH